MVLVRSITSVVLVAVLGTALPIVLPVLAPVVAGPAATAAQPVVPMSPGRPDSRVLAADRPDPQVLAISIDALMPRAVRRLGRDRAPSLWRLLDEGASTLEARTQVELTVTLPNHTSMVTGRRIRASRGGHGVTWNDDAPGRPPTVQAAAGHDVASLFSTAHAAGQSTALFATKTKFSLFQRSWPDGLDRVTIKEEKDAVVVRKVVRDLLRRDRGVTFVHLGAADKAGHTKGFMSRGYLRTVRRLDGLLGTILDAADTDSRLDDLTIILTADHGGVPGTRDHGDARALDDYRVPFTVWGPGISPADLYDLNPGYRDPGRSRPGLKGKQPVRNGDVANLALGLLGLDPVPGSRFGVRRSLLVTAAD